MKLLILGGSVFIGRHIVESALDRGHSVSIFNRGKVNQELFPDVEKLKGDRHSDLDALKGRNWDAVIDTSGYMPRAVRFSAETLADSVERYIYISTQSVYQDISDIDLNEKSPVKQLSHEELLSAEKLNIDDFPTGYSYGKYYGGLKAECENMVRAVMSDRVMVVRPGVVVGPHDYTNRMAYWIERIAQGGEVLCPDQPGSPIRYLDARDLADWIIVSTENKVTGKYNALGETQLTFGQFLRTCKTVTSRDTDLTWVDENDLLEKNVQPWSDLPLWLSRKFEGFFFAKDERAILQGLKYRSMNQTVQDTYDWIKKQAPQFRISHGLSTDREKEILADHTIQQRQQGNR